MQTHQSKNYLEPTPDDESHWGREKTLMITSAELQLIDS